MPSSTHWNIRSAWSKAGVGTSVVLELKRPQPPPHNRPSAKKPSPRVVFDIGATPCIDDAIPAKYVFLSHGHIDHIGALFSHARAHAVTCGGAAPTYFVPAPLLPQVEQCRDAMSLLDASNINPEEDGGRRKSLIDMKLVAVHHGDEVALKGIRFGSKTRYVPKRIIYHFHFGCTSFGSKKMSLSFFIRAIDVDHAGHPAMGYIIGSRTTSGLKKEYQNLGQAKIRDLVASGVSIKADPVETIEVAYTGDTCAQGLQKQSLGNDKETRQLTHGIGALFRAELLLCELTFLDSSEDDEQRSKASERGHLHINDIVGILSQHQCLGEFGDATCTAPGGEGEMGSIADAHQHLRWIVFYHLSAKYQPARRALDLIAEGLPLHIRDRCHIAISSMLSEEENCQGFPIQPNGCISLSSYLSWKDEITSGP
ncbi:hypothetical protein ACHAWF_004644 [Thalassiosira exigua]